jgi:predicted nuclease of predicted toxin-antitoxin system
LRFLVDAQLPPALVRWLRGRGHVADHVRDLGSDVQPDTSIVDHAIKTGAVIITKDSDFSRLSANSPDCRVVWLRFGNATSASLLRSLEPVFAEIEVALEAGQKLVEVSR